MVLPEDPAVLMTEEHIELAFDDTKTKPIELSVDFNLPAKPLSDFLSEVSSSGLGAQHNSLEGQSSVSIDPVEASSFWRKLLFWKKRSHLDRAEDDDIPLNSKAYELVLCVQRDTESVGRPTFTLMAKLGEVQGNLRVLHFQGSASLSTPPFKQITFDIQFADLEKPTTPLSIDLLNFNVVDPSSPVTIKQTDHFSLSATATGGGAGGSIGFGANTGRDKEHATTEDIKFKGVYVAPRRKEISYTWKAPQMLALDGECQFQVGIPNTVKKGVMLNLPKDAKKARNWHSLKLQLAQSS